MKKFFIIIGCIILLFTMMIAGAYWVAPGSYANSELYVVNIPYNQSDSLMIKLKKYYPEYQYYIYPTYKEDSTLVEIISKVIYTKNDTIVEDKYIYAPPKNYIINSKKDTVRYEAGDSILVEDQNGFIKFYLRDIGYAVNCRLYKLKDTEQTRVALVAAISNKKNEGFKQINTKNLSKEENKIIKKEFEEKILDKLGKWKHDGIFSFSIFDE